MPAGCFAVFEDRRRFVDRVFFVADRRLFVLRGFFTRDLELLTRRPDADRTRRGRYDERDFFWPQLLPLMALVTTTILPSCRFA